MNEDSKTSGKRRLNVLIVVDHLFWVLGMRARAIFKFNPWIRPTLLSGTSVAWLAANQPEIFKTFDLIHFETSHLKRAMEPLIGQVPVAATHHHVCDWDAIKHITDADALMVVARQWETDLYARGIPREQVVYVPNGVDTEIYKRASAEGCAALRRELGIAPEAVVLGFAASRSSDEFGRKGTDTFEAAMIKLASRLKNLELVVSGLGWQEMIARLEAQGVKCHWMTFQREKSDVARLYSAMDFYWVTSRVEGGPVPLIEAMSAGVCCLSTPVGLAPELVKHGENGFLIPIGDADGFAETTFQLASQPAQREEITRRARQSVLAEYEERDVSRQINEVYRSALRRFSQRHGRGAELVDLVPSGPINGTQELDKIPLEGFSGDLQSLMRYQENEQWYFWLLGFKEIEQARKIALEEWKRDPTNFHWAKRLAETGSLVTRGPVKLFDWARQRLRT